MQKGKYNTIVDSAWGSSAKGAASARLAEIYKIENVASTNLPNAGHTCIANGEKFVGKVLPTPIFIKKHGRGHPDMTAWVGPTSGFEAGQLQGEISQIGLTVGKDLHIHSRAAVVEKQHIDAESPGGILSTEHVSSTMSVSGAVVAMKMMRLPGVKLAKDLDGLETVGPMDFYRGIWSRLEKGESFLHEVSQGWALSLNSGTHYPTCTSRECTPQQAYADMGVRPNMVGDVYMNVRTFPIRVGNNYDSSGKQVGYSGDCLPDQIETSWADIGKNADMPQDETDSLLLKEKTTVTKKLRRVFTPSWTLLKDSAEFCGATKLILNFPQYIHWSAYGIRGEHKEFLNLHPAVRAYVDKMQEVTNLPVVMIGTAAEHDSYIWLG